jgi:hypothetical protein
MIPASYSTLAALLFVLGGLVTCFAGYRLFRLVLGIYGFYAGAMVASSMVDPGSTFTIGVAILAGGLVGAVVMIVAYFLGVGLVGAGLAALALSFAWRIVGGEPPTILVVVVCVVGAIAALSFVRYVVVFGTSIAGAWTFMVGAFALTGDAAPLEGASAPGVWVVYPIDLLPKRWWVLLALLGLSIVGVVTQLATTTRLAKRRKKKKE